jgi:hypothetical protein
MTDREVPEKPTDQADAPDGATLETTGNTVAEVAAPPADGKLRQRRGGAKGGKAGKRHVALMGLDIALPDNLDLKSHADRMGVLEAVATAIAKGRTSALVAQTLVTVIREARSEAESAWQKLAERQAQVIEALRSGRVVDAG